MHQRGIYMAEEFKGKGSHVILGPVAGPLGRSPYGGRNWEGFSSDPYLTGVAMEETITGMQSVGVQACSKHYIGNEQETQRNPSSTSFGSGGSPTGPVIEAVSANIDDRTMHELYLWPFANAVKAGTASIMCSYNRINGSYGCQNSKTLNGLLKDELGFQGYVMSDWLGTHSGVPAIEAGLDMNMPGGIDFLTPTPSYWGANITTALSNGSLANARLDDMVRRIMTPYYFLGQDQGFPTIDPSGTSLNFFSPSTWVDEFVLNGTSNRDVRANHASLIRELGAAGSVLLKNERNALPLLSPKNIAIFGNDAGDFTRGMYFLNIAIGADSGNSEFGTLPVGGGSGTGRFSYVVTPLDAIKARAAKDGAIVQYVLDNDNVTFAGVWSIAPSPPDVCLVFLKTWASEGSDRIDLEADWNSTTLVNTVAAGCNNTVVITHSGGINTLPFAEHPNVTAILAAHYPGQETGNSIVDILYGDVNPSGHLPYTIARSAGDYKTMVANSSALLNTTDPNAWQSDFTERLLIDYRYFDAENLSVQFEFGFGLSYTSFEMSDLDINHLQRDIPATPPPALVLPGGNPTLWDNLFEVKATVRNSGNVTGAAVSQLYLGLPAEAGEGTPVRVLRGFEKVELGPGESSQLNFILMRRDISYWNVNKQEWIIPSGKIRVEVGFSSRDIKLISSLNI
jgi:beta-glucosidase